MTDRLNNEDDCWKRARSLADFWRMATDSPFFAVGYWMKAMGQPFDPDIHLRFGRYRRLGGFALEHAQNRYEDGRCIAAEMMATGGLVEWQPVDPKVPRQIVQFWHAVGAA